MRKILLLIALLVSIIVNSQTNQPVMIKWIDIVATDGGWRTYDEMIDWYETRQDTVVQIGFIVYEDDNKIVLTDSFFKENEVIGYCVCIPKYNIIELKKIKQ